jgi:hypothetical protein
VIIALVGAQGSSDQDNGLVATVKEAHQTGQVRVRFYSDHARSEITPCAHPAADMRADIETQVVGPNELGIEAAQARAPKGDAAVNEERSQQPDRWVNDRHGDRLKARSLWIHATSPDPTGRLRQ